MKTAGVFLAMLLTTAACASGNVRLTHQYVNPMYGAGQFAYAGAGRDLRVDVAGNPFGGDAQTFGRAVTEAMQNRHFGPATNFTTSPGADARSAYRVVMLFDPPRSFNPMELCDGSASALPTQTDQDGVSVFGAFCRGNYSLSSVKGRIGAADGADDPAFRQLVGRVTHALFPPDRRADPSDRCKPPVNC